jgi:hypothetical protein
MISDFVKIKNPSFYLIIFILLMGMNCQISCFVLAKQFFFS